jgi:DNA modification methylase
MKDIPDKSIDLVLTDIPYGKVNRPSNGLRLIDKGCANIVNFNIEEMLSSVCRISSGSVYCFCGTEQVSYIRSFFVSVGMSTRLVIWSKTNPSPMNGQHIWLSSVECCVYGKFSGATFNEFCCGSVLKYPCGTSKIHPTEKPLKMFEYLVGVSSNKNDKVLDPFMGSGTTGVACKKLNRDFIGIELDADYFKIASDRIDKPVEVPLF